MICDNENKKAHHDFKDKLKEKGIDFDSNFMILEVCNPHKAKEVLTSHIDLSERLSRKKIRKAEY